MNGADMSPSSVFALRHLRVLAAVAVGAWSAGVLAILPIVYLHRKSGWLITGIMAAVILGATVQTGSRQGIIYGGGGFLFGLFVSVFLVRTVQRTTIWIPVAKTAAVMLLIGGTIVLTLQNSELTEWLKFRFQGVTASRLKERWP